MKKRLHNNIILAIEQILQEVIERNRYGDRILEQVFKNNKQWGARDRKLIASATYDLIRWWRRYEYAAQLIRDKSRFRKAISAYLLLQDEYELPQWLLLNDLNYNTLKERYYDDTLPFPVKASIPDWLHEIGSKELGKSWETEINALNDQAKLIIRVNTLKTNKSQLMEYLKQSEIDCFGIDGYPDALCISKRLNVFQTELFKEGLFEVQDASSQLVAPFLEVTPGMRVIDACAGGGGKSLHLAALMQNRGKIISMDIEEHKLYELTKRSRRNGAHIIETRLINSTKVIKRLRDTADRLLLDVPCSGLGVLRRNPDAKWKLDQAFIEDVKQKQRDILESYSIMVKPNGKMVYATCSILPSENELQIQSFLESHKDFVLEEEHIIRPSSGYDGFYMARMKRL